MPRPRYAAVDHAGDLRGNVHRPPIVRLAVVLAALALVTSAPHQSAPVASAGEPTRCRGTIFFDRDADGTRRTADIERGIGGTGIEVTGADGEAFVLASNDDGSWAFETDAVRFPIRVVFTPPEGLAVSLTGSNQQTGVVFVDGADECAGEPLELGLYRPDEFCAPDPTIITSCFALGSAPEHDTSTAVLSVSNSIVDNGSTEPRSAADWMDPVYEPIATTGDVGAVYGQAVAPDGTVYAAAFVKRHTRLTSRLNENGNPTVVYRIESGAEPTVFAIVDPTATDPHQATDGALDYQIDAEAMDDVYAAGLGDIEISPDGTSLFAVDLGRRRLVEIDTADGGIDATVDLDGPTLGIDDCAVTDQDRYGDLRAFGLGWGPDDELLIGVVCSAESTVIDGLPIDETTPAGQAPGDASQLVGYVFERLDDGGFRSRLSWPLAGDRGNTQNNGLLSNEAEWHPWVPIYPFAQDHPHVSYPQPAITDIAVASDDSLIVALGDRWGHQTAPKTVAPAGGGEFRNIDETIIAGDIQRACRVDDGWVIEGDADCPGGVGIDVEFFGGERYGWHDETALGSVARVPFGDEVVVSQMDPIPVDDTWQSGGLAWHDTTSGEYRRGVRLYDGRYATPDSTFEKASGIGDISIWCGGPPLQIGGMVWHDVDGNGIQDPAELRPTGVHIELHSVAGDPLATTVTDADGRYWFDDTNVPGGLAAGDRYIVAITEPPDTAAPSDPAARFARMQPTRTDGTPDHRLDSDALTGVIGTASGASMVSAFVTAGDDAATPADETVNNSIDLGLIDRFDLALDAIESDRAGGRDIIRFDLAVHNQGSEPAGPFTVVGAAPAGTTVVGASGASEAMFDSDRVVWTFDERGSLESGDSVALEMTVRIDDADRLTFVATAEITADAGDDVDSDPGNADPNGQRAPEDDEASVGVARFAIAGTVWHDLDGSGSIEMTDPVEPERGISDVAIVLVDAGGTAVERTVTGPGGDYDFPLLRSGTYRLLIPPSEFEEDRPLAGLDRSTGAHVDGERIDLGAGFRSSEIELAPRSDATDGVPTDVGRLLTVDIGLSVRPTTSFVDDVLPKLIPAVLIVGTGWYLWAARRRQRRGPNRTP